MVALEILTLLLENATNDSVEVSIAFLKECGAKLEELSRRGISGKLSLGLNKQLISCLVVSHIREVAKYLTRGTVG